MDVLVLKINRKMNGGDVSETKDPAIKLFGKRIPVPECHFPEKSDVGCQTPYKSEVTDICNDITKTETGDVHMEESGNQDSSSVKEDNKQITRDEDGPEANGKPMEDPSESSSVENKKTLKKPDKILACPRCNSLETKFCYFNNYNVNQPRHYCKNCQRYWTAGGTVRNVPVGAGRRKNKNLVSQYNSQVLASPEPATQANPQDFSCSDSCTLRPSTSHGTVLKFGPEGPLYEPMATVDLMDQKGYVSDLSSTRGKIEEPSATSIPACSVQENQIKENVKEQDSLIGSSIEPPQPNPQQYYPVPPWVFPLNQVWHSGASFVAAQCSSQPVLAPAACNPVQRGPTPLLPVPTFCAPAIPLQFVPTSYWGYLPVWTAGKRHMSTVEPVSDGELTSGSGNDSPTLGKHSRDRNSFDEEESEKGVLVPKTLRIDDPEEASKSSIWATLGFNTNRKESESRCGIFRPYKSSAEWKGPSTTAEALEPNPAALSRSHTFQEST